MKGIPIKFRAKEIIKGEYVYGDLIHCGDDVCIREHTTVDMFLTHEGDTKVAPDSVAQLVGYDVDGKEVYEGDALKDLDGEYYVPFLEARVIWNATFGAMWTLPFERPHSRAARQIDLKAMSFDFWNRIEKVRRKDKKKEKWLKAVEDDERCTDKISR